MSVSVFGMIVAGRLVSTDFQAVDETHFVINVPEADNIRHIIVFLTGSQPLPDNTAAGVYFSWPEPNSPPTWIYLGFLSNSKPSAVFKVASLKHGSGAATVPSGLVQQFSHNAQVGIAVEPEVQVAGLTPAAAEPSTVPSFVEFVQKMLQNFVNYATSFSVTPAQMAVAPNESYVPLSVVQRWYDNFQRRLEMNPNFWKS
ncbi:Protein OPI10 [Amphibalanus amphitrite]|uniref:Protein OPI10 n=1 Tax=Amphibalanus amphitrite TaxID=1232801 RepID=A0A6A4W0I7_AMPAM|nr:protein OPI10 homolog [Amphibalanus amphitrite]XP_043203788.1 protein OPI10 homolog [Amphibalanus amphitrite]XP_043203789.1 protein OPI10 homolog [Amphibalanus amphitrite]XP_043203790.1 protein OPI10 homolog [Amphibalanus amphitrite]XP_043203791.1 protein OPI10 homolog [Amphibalanus amphitrite]XP_043203792.1 protein OPI10 homolog [Amphibalanus amphitrite]XP_043203793.1 protein OPI10 homolog [Amphibalanus amphitrite]XP_043203795.1 protein OPI10 homolog [Amphibalanus amphitrite]XP_04320379